jgi:hypothetical protein
VFGAFIGSFPIGYTCCSYCSCVGSELGWCMTHSNCFLRLLIIALDIFWNQQVLGKPLHYFLT